MSLIKNSAVVVQGAELLNGGLPVGEAPVRDVMVIARTAQLAGNGAIVPKDGKMMVTHEEAIDLIARGLVFSAEDAHENETGKSKKAVPASVVKEVVNVSESAPADLVEVSGMVSSSKIVADEVPVVSSAVKVTRKYEKHGKKKGR